MDIWILLKWRFCTDPVHIVKPIRQCRSTEGSCCVLAVLTINISINICLLKACQNAGLDDYKIQYSAIQCYFQSNGTVPK